MNRPKILYLDQNAWIALARGAWDKIEHPADHAALMVVGQALMAGHILAPLSFTNIYETKKIDIPERRAHLAEVMATISGGKVLRGRRRILEAMLLSRIGEATGVAVPTLPEQWFMSNLWFEAVVEHSSGTLDASVSQVVLDYARECPKEALFSYLVGANEALRKEAVRRYSAESQALLTLISTRRQRVAGETFAMRLRVYAAQLLVEEIEYVLGLGRRSGLAWLTATDIGAKLAKSLIADVPILEVERQLAVRLEDQPHALTENDLRDMSAFTTALPLVDIMVAERQFVNLSRQAGLDRRYGTILLTSVHELTAQMLAPSTESKI